MSAEANDKKRFIRIRGANENNLKNLSVDIPRDQFVVLTGLSGSGKSSLAFDTIYAEGQRRYMESLSSYARQFLGQMEKPDVDTIEGLSPAISIDQKSTNNNPRSTVGTVTEIHDYLRLLYARIGIPHCPKCGRVIRRQTVDEVVEQVMAFGEGARVQIIAPAVRGRKGEHVKLLEQIQKDGYVRVKVDGEIYDIADVPKLDKKLKHTIDVIVDRIVVRAGAESRLAGSLETAFAFGAGLAKVEHNGEEQLFSENYACPDCGVSIEELTPRMFSFNNPYGACPTCSGLGALMKIDPALIVPNEELSLRQGAINVTGWQSSNTASIAGMYLAALGDKYGFDMDTPFNKLSEQARHAILYGTGNERIHIEYRREFGEGSYDSPFEGVIPNLERRYKETQSDYMKHEIEEYMANIPCPDCKGNGCAPGTTPEVCPDCKGTGSVRTTQRTPFGMAQSTAPCSKCRGTGKIIHQPCPTCRGMGNIRKQHKISVSVPAGIDDGQTISLRGQGNSGANGGPQGDMLVTIIVRPHARFERDGSSVLLEQEISYAQAALGAEVEVPTLDGKVKLTIPEGTQPDAVFRMRGKGIPYLRGSGRGDQFVTIRIAVPKNLTSAQKELLRQFAATTGEADTLKTSLFNKKKK